MNPIFLPRGVLSGTTPDSQALAEEFMEANKIAGDTTHYQWAARAFTDINTLVRGGPVIFDVVKVAALLQTTQGQAPILPPNVSADPNLWSIPYNRGYSRIGSGIDNGEMILQVTTKLPCLFLAVFQGQYVRWDTGDATIWSTEWPTGIHPRVRWGISLDKNLVLGSGPNHTGRFTTLRGAGYAAKTASAVAVAAQILMPGDHTIEAVAAQMSCLNDDTSAEDTEAIDKVYDFEGPSQGVCIGNRKLFYIGLPLTALLRGA